MDIILNTFGTSLSRDNGAFVISNQDGKKRIPIKDIRSIQINKGTQITSDAVFLAIENEIEILFIDRVGNPKGRIWSNEYGSISSIRKGQLQFTWSRDAVDWIKGVIYDKITNQQALLLSFSGPSNNASIKSAIDGLDFQKNNVSELDGNSVADIARSLRGMEGIASLTYFSQLDELLPAEYRFCGRSQHFAKNVSNALLNYGYGILYGKVERALIESGIDPYIGILHSDQYKRPTLVYDIIERYRGWIDYVVMSLLRQKIVSKEMYSIDEEENVWMEGLGKRIVIQSVNDYFEEKIVINGLSRSRDTHIQLYSQRLAQLFKRYVV